MTDWLNITHFLCLAVAVCVCSYKAMSWRGKRIETMRYHNDIWSGGKNLSDYFEAIRTEDPHRLPDCQRALQRIVHAYLEAIQGNEKKTPSPFYLWNTKSAGVCTDKPGREGGAFMHSLFTTALLLSALYANHPALPDASPNPALIGLAPAIVACTWIGCAAWDSIERRRFKSALDNFESSLIHVLTKRPQ
ncbi:MAG: hypothetical protein R3268_00190 [Acidiferrobacterales bacterium]|nr:hypothetical protein [Acidiferrobacterales bacterium]